MSVKPGWDSVVSCKESLRAAKCPLNGLHEPLLVVTPLHGVAPVFNLALKILTDSDATRGNVLSNL